MEGHSCNIPVYQFIRENGGFDNSDTRLIKTDFCENVLEARRKEREYIEQLNATLNTVKRPYASKAEKEETLRHWYELCRNSQRSITRISQTEIFKPQGRSTDKAKGTLPKQSPEET